MNNIISGLEGQLQSAQFGTGPDGDDWYIPPPQYGMDYYTLSNTLEKLMDLKANISQVVASVPRLPFGGTSTTTLNGAAMIQIFDQRIKDYQAALDSLLIVADPIQTALPTQTIPKPEPDPGQVPEPDPGQVPETPAPGEEKKPNWLLYLGIGAAGYWLLKKKRSVQGVSNETVAVVSIAALVLLSRKKQTEPEATVPTALVPENEIEDPSKFIR